MKCDSCSSVDATVHITQVAGAEVRIVDLCEHCAELNGVNNPAGISVAELMASFGKPGMAAS